MPTDETIEQLIARVARKYNRKVADVLGPRRFTELVSAPRDIAREL